MRYFKCENSWRHSLYNERWQRWMWNCHRSSIYEQWMHFKEMKFNLMCSLVMKEQEANTQRLFTEKSIILFKFCIFLRQSWKPLKNIDDTSIDLVGPFILDCVRKWKFNHCSPTAQPHECAYACARTIDIACIWECSSSLCHCIGQPIGFNIRN